MGCTRLAWYTLIPGGSCSHNDLISQHTHGLRLCPPPPPGVLTFLSQALTEQMISQMVLEIKGSYKISYHANGPEEDPVEIDFTPPW